MRWFPNVRLSKQMMRDLTFAQPDGKAAKVFYEVQPTRVLLPTYYAHQHDIKSEVSSIPRATPDLKMRGSLYETKEKPQQTMCQRATEALHHDYHTIINMPCGTGKTNTAIAVALAMGCKTLVLCHTSTLIDQWLARIIQWVPDAKVGILRQNECNTKDRDFVIGSIQSLHARKQGYPETARTYGLVIVDEVHNIAAHTFARVLTLLNYRYILGLTATLRRKDGCTQAIEYLVGKPCMQLVYADEFVSHTQAAMVRPKRTDVQLTVLKVQGGREYVKVMRNGKVFHSRMVTKLTEDPIRQAIVMKVIRRMLAFPGRQGLVLSNRVDHLKAIFEDLKDPDNVEVFTGSHKTRPHKKGTEKKFDARLTLSTYQQFAEAIDFPGDYLIMAAPCSDPEQAIGRILRGHNPQLQPVVIDIMDPFSVFHGMFRKRMKFYVRAGYTIVHVNSSQL